MSGKSINRKKAAGATTMEPKETAKIGVEANAASTSPPPGTGIKPTTGVDATPTQRSKRRNKNRTPPTPGVGSKRKNAQRTPPTPGFSSKKKNAQRLQRVQKNAPMEDLDVAKVAGAAALFKKTTKSTTVTVNNTMWLFLCECERAVGSGDIVFLRVPVNHNCVNSKVAHEITNNILGNPVRANLEDKFHEPNMGTDMHCLMTYNTKVSLYPS